MTDIILTDHIAGISELKANPMKTVLSAGGATVAILNRNQPAFYAVPPETYEYFMELAENAELMEIVRKRQDQEAVEVDLDEL